jgi:peroxiredoxin
MKTLAAELEEFLADFNERIPDDVRAVMMKADAGLAASGIEDRVLKGGAIAPDFTLPDIEGKPVRLSDSLARGPVILTFYRGGWCPYCNLELRAYQRLLPTIKAAGAQVIAVSPQTVTASADTVQKNGLSFPVLADLRAEAAKAFGLAFELPAELKALYATFGHSLPAINGADEWVLPLPGTFVLAASGKIILASARANYRRRLEPAEALAAIVAATRRAA